MSHKDDSLSTNCGCMLVILAINLTLGGMCFDYTLSSVLGLDIPWYGDALCGLVLGEFVIPAALVCWILRMCGVDAPFIQR